MKICQVNPGCGIPIPPPKWGAIERIVWEYTQNLRKLGHTVDIKFANDIKPGEYDIVHCHVGNLCDSLISRNIPYIFHLHDHHAYFYGKDSFCYKTNKRAIDGSILTLVPGKFLIEYFNSPKIEYLSHGVNTEIFINNFKPRTHDLLCIANNGMGDNNGFDRKGFSYAIKAAIELGLSITIAGPNNNSNFFAENKWVLDYPKLSILTEPEQEQLVELYNTHKLFLNPSILEAGHPNLTLLEAMACGTPVLATIENETELSGVYRIERDVSNIMEGVERILNNYEYYTENALQTAKILSFENITNELINKYNKVLNIKKNMREQLINIYENTEITIHNKLEPKNKIDFSFIRGAKVEVIGDKESEYRIEFIDTDNDIVEYVTTIKNNHWSKTSKEYFINWLVNVYENGELIASHKFNPTNKRVYITLESSAIGDTIAWFPILEEFRKKWNCKLIVSTFNNTWFENEYPDITFVKPGQIVEDLYAMYSIGWFYIDKKIDYNKNPINFRAKPLQETATSILRLEPMEIKPKITVPSKESTLGSNYVVIAPHASAHAKYWNAEGGWQSIINHINGLGYRVVMLTQEKLGDTWHDSKLGGTLTNVIDKTGNHDIIERMVDIKNAKLFIGVGSGLSWLSWALGTKTILISGFSYPYTEFKDCIRLFNENENVCSGCFNRHWLNPGDWDWCPDHKGTNRMFECSKKIEIPTVIDAINSVLI